MDSTEDKNGIVKSSGVDRRKFLQGAAVTSLAGVAAMTLNANAQTAPQTPIEGFTRQQLRSDMMAGIEEDIKKDL
jgi:secreted PhoX family phosphatase